MDTYTPTELGVVFKISERCNLACKYCYFFFSGDESWKDRSPLVSEEIVHGLGSFMAKCAHRYSLRSLDLSFHGGEPLLMKKKRFDAMCQTLRSYEDGFTFQFQMQTNGALLDTEWVDLLARHSVGVGVSLDGTRSANDVYRLDMRGRSTYDATVRGLRLLQDSAKQGVGYEPGLLCVVNPDMDGAETLRHFVEDLNVKHLNFLLPDSSHDSAIDPTYTSGVLAYVRSAVYQWARMRRKDVRLRFLSELIAVMGCANGEVSRFIANDYRNLVVVSSDGKIGPEDTLHGLAPRFREMPFNVLDSQPDDVFASNVWNELGVAARAPDACQSCKWKRVCQGGKPANRFSSENGFNNPSIYCEELKVLYGDVMRMLTLNRIPIELIEKNLEIC